MGLKTFLTSIAAVVICALFMIYFIMSWLAVQNPSSPLLTNEYGFNQSASALNYTISKFYNNASGASSTLGESIPSSVEYVFLIFKGAFFIPLSFLSFGINSIIAIKDIIITNMGGGAFGVVISLAMALITAVLTLTLVFYIIKFIRAGQE